MKDVNWPLVIVAMALLALIVFVGMVELKDTDAKNQCRMSNGIVVEQDDNWRCQRQDR